MISFFSKIEYFFHKFSKKNFFLNVSLVHKLSRISDILPYQSIKSIKYSLYKKASKSISITIMTVHLGTAMSNRSRRTCVITTLFSVWNKNENVFDRGTALFDFIQRLHLCDFIWSINKKINTVRRIYIRKVVITNACIDRWRIAMPRCGEITTRLRLRLLASSNDRTR